MDRCITIKLIRSELVYNIELVAYAVGETVKSEDEREQFGNRYL